MSRGGGKEKATQIACPSCGHRISRVSDSRGSDNGAAIRRRRVCTGCGARFSTVEVISVTGERSSNLSLISPERVRRALAAEMQRAVTRALEVALAPEPDPQPTAAPGFLTDDPKADLQRWKRLGSQNRGQ